MRSTRGLAAALILLLTVPGAITIAVLTGGGGEPVIHFGIGAGMVLLALAAFDFGLPRPVAWFGAATCGAFGGIFLLQGVADALGNESLYNVAFFVLGQMPERILPELILGWFVALLILGSEGRTRVLGAILLAVTVGAEVVTLVGPVVGIDVPDIKLRWLLPFVWLLFESAKAAPRLTSRPVTGASFADSPAT